MADTNLYQILSGLYTGLNKLNVKSDAKDEYISGVIGANWTSPSSVQERLELLEAGTSAASGVLTIAGKEYSPLSSVEVLSSDIITNVQTALAADATGLAGAADVYANDMFLSGKIDDIASSFLTGYQNSNDALNVLTLGTNGQNITGSVLVDGATIVKDANGKIASGVKLVKKAEVDNKNAAEYFLADKNGTKLGDVEINVPKDQFLSAAIYNKANETLDLTFILADGSASTTPIDVHDMVHEYTGSDAITVADDKAGNSAISLKLALSGTNDNKYLNITSAGLGLSGITEAIAAVSTDATTGLATLSGALDGYLSGNAVSNKFAEVDAKLGDAGSSGIEGQIFVADASGNLDASGKTIGGATLAASPADTTLATEAAVKAADDALKAALSGAISGAYTDKKVVLGNGGTGLKASAYEIGDDVALEAAPTANKLATEKALWALYDKTVNTDLADLANNVAALANGI